MPLKWCARCVGTGMVECLCGGDLCVCENNGEAFCPCCDGDGEYYAPGDDDAE